MQSLDLHRLPLLPMYKTVGKLLLEYGDTNYQWAYNNFLYQETESIQYYKKLAVDGAFREKLWEELVLKLKQLRLWYKTLCFFVKSFQNQVSKVCCIRPFTPILQNKKYWQHSLISINNSFLKTLFLNKTELSVLNYNICYSFNLLWSRLIHHPSNEETNSLENKVVSLSFLSFIKKLVNLVLWIIKL